MLGSPTERKVYGSLSRGVHHSSLTLDPFLPRLEWGALARGIGDHVHIDPCPRGLAAAGRRDEVKANNARPAAVLLSPSLQPALLYNLLLPFFLHYCPTTNTTALFCVTKLQRIARTPYSRIHNSRPTCRCAQTDSRRSGTSDCNVRVTAHLLTNAAASNGGETTRSASSHDPCATRTACWT